MLHAARRYFVDLEVRGEWLRLASFDTARGASNFVAFTRDPVGSRLRILSRPTVGPEQSVVWEVVEARFPRGARGLRRVRADEQ